MQTSKLRIHSIAGFTTIDSASCMVFSGVSRIVLKSGQNRDFGKKEGAKKNEKK